MSHINSEKHQTLLTSIKFINEQDGEFVEIPENVNDNASEFCSICNQILEFTSESIKNLLNSCIGVHDQLQFNYIMEYFQ